MPIAFALWSASGEATTIVMASLSRLSACFSSGKVGIVSLRQEYVPPGGGRVIVLVGLLLYVIGDYATLYVVLHLSLWIVIVGLVLSFIGPVAAREIAFPLLYLLTSIPLPVFLYSALSGRLQLWSSALGVGCLQFVGVTAFREGNVIDLGPVQLQVAEACSGIRYLFPLTSLALLCAYLFRDRMWKRVLLVLSALPISVLVNGLRIGIVGILVEFYGVSSGRGFFASVRGLGTVHGDLGPADSGNVVPVQGAPAAQTPAHSETGSRGSMSRNQKKTQPSPAQSIMAANQVSPAYFCSVALLIPFAAVSWMIGERQDTPPARPAFMDFSMDIGSWHGTPLTMEPQYISALRFDDYLLADYVSQDGTSVNAIHGLLPLTEKRPIRTFPAELYPGRRMGNHLASNYRFAVGR